MRLFNSVGPNPRVVTLFLAEKGITLPHVTVDIRGGENRRAPYIDAVNPAGQTPALELDNGSIVTEITAICEYLEERHPSPPLIGTTAEERAETRMWVRRADLKVCEPLTAGFRGAEGLPMFEQRTRCLPEAADAQIAGRQYIAGDRFTLADIMLFAFLDFGRAVGQPFAPENRHVAAWFDRVSKRPAFQPDT